MYYIVYMIQYAEEIVKRINKGLIPKEIFLHINNAFMSIETTKDKHSLKELYENIIDRQTIAEYELKEKKEKVNFIDSKEIIKMLGKQKTSL
ncbi:MAG: hypothetical protein FWH41_02780 [Treponema sp.]|nr:hypothetical protein [Treponema sp.]